MLAIHRRTLVLFVAICLGHVLLISSQVQTKTGVPFAESVAFGAFAGVQRVMGAVAGVGRGFWMNHVIGGGVANENALLRQHVAELEARLQQQQAQLTQVQSLERALELKQSVQAPTLAARVIAGDPTPGSSTPLVTIDRGSDDGVTADMAVIAANGVVGRVIGRPLPHASQVQLLIGHSAAAGAVLERTQAGGIIEGGGTDPALVMNYVPNSIDVKIGDRVLTSGEDGIFPRGFPIGTVVRAGRSTGGQSRTLAVEPAVDFSHIDIVLVILARPPTPGGGTT